MALAKDRLYDLSPVFQDGIKIGVVPEDGNNYYIKNKEKFYKLVERKDPRIYNFKIKILKETFIPGYKDIPNFYYFETVKVNNNNEVELNRQSKISPEIAHSNFIVEGLRGLFPNISDDEIVEFYKNNKEKINKVRHSPYMEGTGAQFLGRGADGPAFKMGRGVVIKFYTDKGLYNSSLRDLEVVESGKPLIETEVRLYDVGSLGQPDERDEVYYNIIEYLKPVKGKDAKGKDLVNPLDYILQKIGNNFDSVFSDDNSTTKELKNYLVHHKERNDRSLNETLLAGIEKLFNKTENMVSNFSPDVIRNISYFAEMHKLQSDWLKKLCAEVTIKLLTGRRDLHSGNFGVTNAGYVRCFDPFWSGRF